MEGIVWIGYEYSRTFLFNESIFVNHLNTLCVLSLKLGSRSRDLDLNLKIPIRVFFSSL